LVESILLFFFQSLSEDELKQCDVLFSTVVHFKDPFNDVRGIAAVKRIFQHMFDLCEVSRFEVHDCCGHNGQGYIMWTFHYKVKGRGEQRTIKGMSHVTFNVEGEVTEHIDYWGSGKQIYEFMPMIGWLLRQVRELFLQTD
jgi:steroid delta-isomerase